MSDPFLIEGPSVISFSGGRTSGYMLRRILDAHDGKLPDDVYVLFANTGKERPETLEFIHDVATRWGVQVRWLEFRAPDRCLEVTYESASRRGEPFDEMIAFKKRLPNALVRICTQYLKVQPIQSFITHTLGLTDWTSAVGIRYDEPKRWRILGQDSRCPHEFKVGPLVEAKVTKPMVLSYWAGSPFDLALGPDESNCDLCFLKGILKREAVIRKKPELAEWWASKEEAIGHVFRRDTPNYRQLQMMARRQGEMFPFEDDPTDQFECLCHD